jgi:hypothetical protein
MSVEEWTQAAEDQAAEGQAGDKPPAATGDEAAGEAPKAATEGGDPAAEDAATPPPEASPESAANLADAPVSGDVDEPAAAIPDGGSEA